MAARCLDDALDDLHHAWRNPHGGVCADLLALSTAAVASYEVAMSVPLRAPAEVDSHTSTAHDRRSPLLACPWVVELLEGPAGMMLATAGDDLVPDVVQVIGCRALSDGRVVVVVARSQAEGVLELIEAGAPVAVTFAMPSTHRTVQLKGPSASIAGAKRADREAVARYRRIFEEELALLGFSRAYTRAMLSANDDDLVAITFEPAEAYEQTPGPGAGQAIARGIEGER